MSRRELAGILSILVLLISSCKSRRDIQDVAVEKEPKEVLVDTLSSYIDFHFFTAKAAVDATINDEKKSFKSYVKIRKDSALWMNITFAITAFKGLITQDSIKTINKIKKCYFQGDIKSINQLLATDLSFDMIQNALLGFPLFFDKNTHYKSRIDSNLLYFSEYSIKQVERLRSKPPKKKTEIEQYWLNPDNLRLAKMAYYNLADSTTILVDYDKYEEIEEQFYPVDIRFYVLTPTNNIDVNIHFSKFRINKPLELTLEIPEKYDICE